MSRKSSQKRQLVVGYARVSTDKQGISGVGLESQKEGIRAFADKMDWHLIEIFEDVATGMGSSSVNDRLGLQNALVAARENNARFLAYDWSRFSRDTSSFDDIAQLLPNQDHILTVVDGKSLEEASAAGQHAYAQKQGEAISKSTKEGMAKKRAEGVVFGNPDILSIQVTGSAAASEKAIALTRRIANVLLELDDDTLTRAEIAESLNQRGILTGQGNLWNEERIRDQLRKARTLIADDQKKATDALYANNPAFGLF
jgi:DNA invertase Pin-like site-specific DNA recombinase